MRPSRVFIRDPCPFGLQGTSTVAHVGSDVCISPYGVELSSLPWSLPEPQSQNQIYHESTYALQVLYRFYAGSQRGSIAQTLSRSITLVVQLLARGGRISIYQLVSGEGAASVTFSQGQDPSAASCWTPCAPMHPQELAAERYQSAQPP